MPLPGGSFTSTVGQDIARISVPFFIAVGHGFFYGFYILLFCIGRIVLRQRPKTSERIFHRVSLYVLFALATVSVPLNVVRDIFYVGCNARDWEGQDFSSGIDVMYKLQIGRFVIFLLMSLVVDAILIFRYFVICGLKRWRYIIIPAIWCSIVDVSALTSAIVVEGQVIEGDTALSRPPANIVSTKLGVILLAIHTVTNVVLTTMIASKILWISVKFRSIRTPSTTGDFQMVSYHGRPHKSFSTISAIVLESGLLYAITLILYLVCLLLSKTFTCKGYIDTGSILIQVTGIAPTLIIVRANTRNPEDQVENRPLSPFQTNPTGTRTIQSRWEDRTRDEVLSIPADGFKASVRRVENTNRA